MAREAPFSERAAGERAAAWLVTGPVGHLVAFGVDLTVIWLAWARARRPRGGRSGALGRPR